jgi:Helix-turn-helix domain
VVTVPVAARLLGMSERSAYRAAARGDLPTIRLDGGLRVPVARLYGMLGLAIPGRPAAPVIDR